MKFIAIVLLTASSLASTAQASTDLFIQKAQFSTTDGGKGRALFLALNRAGAVPDARGDIQVPNMLIHWSSNSKDFVDKKDACYERPEYRIQFQNNGKWITLNDYQGCGSLENAVATDLVEAFRKVGFDKVEADASMGGKHDQTVTELFVSSNPKDGAIGTFGGDLTEEPVQQ